MIPGTYCAIGVKGGEEKRAISTIGMPCKDGSVGGGLEAS